MIASGFARLLLMQTRRMLTGAVVLFALACGWSLPAQQTNRIDEARVQAVLKAMDAASVKMDWRTAVTNFADDAVITLELHEGGEKYLDTYNKKKYLEMLESGGSAFTDYTAERSDTRLQIATDGQSATVKSTLTEKFTRSGVRLESSSEENYTLQLVAGKLWIKTLSSVVKVK